MVGSVLLLVSLSHTLARELALLPDGHEAGAEPESEGGAKEEATALKTDNDVDVALLANSGVEDSGDLQLQGAHQAGEVGVVRENGHDVLEQDAGRGEVGELAQGGAEVYFKTGEFGGTGGIGGGESSLGAMAGSGGGIGLACGRVGGSGGAVCVLGAGSGVLRVAVRRVLGVGDRSAAHIEGGREGKNSLGKVFFGGQAGASACARGEVSGDRAEESVVVGLAGRGVVGRQGWCADWAGSWWCSGLDGTGWGCGIVYRARGISAAADGGTARAGGVLLSAARCEASLRFVYGAQLSTTNPRTPALNISMPVCTTRHAIPP